MIVHVSLTGKVKNTEQAVFLDIQSAYDYLIEQHKAGYVFGASRILVHDGCYVLKKPLHFYADLPVSIESAEGEHPVVSSGISISSWTRTKINGCSCWKTSLPESVTEIPFFYVNGKTAQSSRWPKKGWYRVQDEREGYLSDETDYDNFHVRKGDFNPKWYDPQNIWIRLIHIWIEETCRLESYDPKELKITTSSRIKAKAKKSDTEFAYFNVREALSEPNEYYFDRQKHELLYISEDDRKPVNAVIPGLSSLVYVDSGARWITIQGIRFQYSGNYLPVAGETLDLREAPVIPAIKLEPTENIGRFPIQKPMYTSSQSATQVPGVIIFDYASDCIIRNCEFSLCGRYGISVISGCRRLLLENNELHHLGGGGIIVYGNNYDGVMKEPSSQVSHLIIRGNHIHDCGLFFYSATGIIIRHAWGCLIEENHIHDLFYSGITCGWVWGYAPSMTHDIRICRNRIHDLGKGILSDMGGIYLLGVQPGTRVWKNVISNIESRYYGGWGLYNDEGCSHTILEKNIVCNCACQGYHIHYGRENIVRWNIFAFNRGSGAAISRNRLDRGCICPGEPHAKTVNFINNVILTKGTPVFWTAVSEMVRDKRFMSDFNIFWDMMKTKDVPFAKEGDIRDYTLEEWREKGFDRHSIIQEPGFRNAEKGDFRLKKNSVLHDYGFSDEDFEK